MKRKTVAALLAIMMCLSNSSVSYAGVPADNAAESNVENINGDDTRYVVVIQDEAGRDQIAQRYDTQVVDDLTDQSRSLENQVVTMDLTDEEVKSLEREEEVLFVEEDIEINACSIPEQGRSDMQEETHKFAEDILSEKDTDKTGTNSTENSQVPGTDKITDSDEQNTENDSFIEIPETSESGTENIVITEKDTEKETNTGKQTDKPSNASQNSNTDLEWNLQMIGVTKDSQNDVPKEENQDVVKIAVLDSGIDVSEDTNVVTRVNLVQEEDYIPAYREDVTGHGTSVAGLISDIDKKAEISSVRILDQENKATLSRVISGIYWCIDNGIDIINMSFGTSVKSQAMHYAVQKAYDAGILMVAAAGNGGTTASVEYPAAFEEVVAVGAVNTKGEKTLESATGNEIELVAPGEQIKADGFFGGKMITSGTSMSVPQVVGAASILLERDLGKSPEFIRDLLNESAKPMEESTYYGNGLVDLEYALEYYDEYAGNYVEGVKNKDVLPENVGEVETFDKPEYVEGLWGDSEHQGVAGNFGEQSDSIPVNQMAAIKAYSIISDFKKEQDKRYFKPEGYKGTLHGYGQYVANTKYLYEVAAAMRITQFASGQSDAAKKTYVNNICKKIKYSAPEVYPGTEAVLDKAIMYVCVIKEPLKDFYKGATYIDYSCRVLGLALHNVEDVYAHRTMLSPGRVLYDSTTKSEPKKRVAKTFYKMDFSSEARWKEIISLTNTKADNIDFGKFIELPYADNPNFFHARFDYGAVNAGETLLYMYSLPTDKIMDFDWAESIFAFEPERIVKYPEMKLLDLSKRIKQVYGKTNENFQLFTG